MPQRRRAYCMACRWWCLIPSAPYTRNRSARARSSCSSTANFSTFSAELSSSGFEPLSGSIRAEGAHERAARLVDHAKRGRAERTRSPATEASWCPLCRQPATITDWRPRADWLAIEGCSCGGFFLRAKLLSGGLGSPAERQALAASVRGFRALGHEVWLAHANDARGGPLTIRTQRPDLPK